MASERDRGKERYARKRLSSWRVREIVKNGELLKLYGKQNMLSSRTRIMRK